MLDRLIESPASTVGDDDGGLGYRKRPGRRGLRSSRAALPYFIALAVLVPLLFFGVAAIRDWRSIEAEAQTRIVYIRDAIAEHATRIFKTHELVALSLRNRIAEMSWDEIAASDDVRDHLAQIEASFPELHAIWLVDREGRLRASSRDTPATERDLSDRDWFRHIRDSGAARVIGRRQHGAVHEDDVFALTVPRRDDEASFDGLIRISISPDYFTDYYASAYPNVGLIALLLRDGEVLVSYPREAEIPRAMLSNPPVIGRLSDPPHAVFGGEARLQTFKQIADLPVYAAFALDERALTTLWLQRLESYVLFFIPAMAALALLGALAWRSHRELEEKVVLRTRALSEAVAEKNQLLKEVHHRVKNNMQIISSLIHMQERVDTSSDETIQRVKAMALVHDLIYSHGDFASVNLGAYTRRLSEALDGAAGSDVRVSFSYDLDHVAVTLDRAMPFALILSEVVTNAMRHAFPGGHGHVAIALERHGAQAVLRVEDDGRGFDPNARNGGFGIKLIRSLAVQLDAAIRWEDGVGAVFVMEFPLVGASTDS